MNEYNSGDCLEADGIQIRNLSSNRQLQAVFMHLLVLFALATGAGCFFPIWGGEKGPEAAENRLGEVLVLTLSDALSRALNDNRQLLDAAEGVVNAQWEVELANDEFGFHWVPNGRAGYGGGKAGTGAALGGGVGFSKKWPTGTQLAVNPAFIKVGRRFRSEVRASLSQPLLRGLGRAYQLSGVQRARFSARTACRELHMAQVKLILRTVQALYELLKAERSLALHRESHHRIQQFYRAAQLKEKMGFADPFDGYRAEMELRYAEEELTDAEERLQETEDVIHDLLAIPLPCRIRVDLPLTYRLEVITLDEAIQLAWKNRVEVDQSEDLCRDRQRALYLAEKNLYPELNLVVDYSNCGGEELFARASHRRRTSAWGVGFATSTDFNPLTNRAVHTQGILGVDSAERAREQTLLAIALEVKKSLRHLERASQRMRLQEKQMKTARGELALARIKFDRGLSDNVNVVQAEKSLRNAQKTYESALIDYIVGEYQLLAATGLLIDNPCPNK